MTLGTPSRRPHRRRFPAAAESVAAARRFAAEHLDGLRPEQCEAVVLMVSELATNAVRHGGSTFEVRVERRSGQVRVEVVDPGPGLPTPRRAGAYDGDGRGLHIVEELSEAWGVRPARTGKIVWFTIAG